MVERFRVARHGGVPWSQAIYQTVELTDHAGRDPERVVGRQLSAALDDLGIDHLIVAGLDPVDSPTERSDCGDGAALGLFEQFIDARAPIVGADANLLLTNAGGNGCGYIGGNTATAPGGNITHDPGRRVMQGRDAWHRNVSAAMHETGHMMGFVHDPHPGWGDNVDGEWHRTPTNSANGVVNLCGRPIPDRLYTPVVNHLYFNDCVAQHIKISVKPPLQQTPEPDEPGDPGDPSGPSAAALVAGGAIAAALLARPSG